MFGLLAAGRLVQTDFVQTDETHVVCALANPDAINHIVVFLTGQQAFPDNLAGAVYLSYLRDDGAPSWQYLGYVTNEKPSAIFRITNLKPVEAVNSGLFSNVSHQKQMAQVGISVEPLEQIKAMTPSISAHSADGQIGTLSDFARKMLESFVEYVSSFASSRPGVAGTENANETYVPLSVVQRWYDNFSRRLNANPFFWRTD